MVNVVVIMSVFNGEKYLREQIDSILGQTGVEISLWIRNDGSTDRSASIIDAYTADARIRVLHGQNLGAMHSFVDAIVRCPFRGDFYAFSDHDDVWLPDKLSAAVEAMRTLPQDRPAMVSARMTITDAALRPVGMTQVPKNISFRNALVQCVTPAGSALINQAALDLVRAKPPTAAAMHDSWLYLLLTAFGSVYFDPIPKVLYRQHGANVEGARHSLLRRWKNRAKRLVVPSRYWPQACEFLALHHESLDASKRMDLERYVGYRATFWTRVRFAFSPSFECQRWQSSIYLRFLCLIGKG